MTNYIRHALPDTAIWIVLLLALLFAPTVMAAPTESGSGGVNTADLPVEALLYSTMPSTAAHCPTMAMDGNAQSYFETVYGMDDGDDFLILLSRAIPVQSITVATGDLAGNNTIADGMVEVSPDGVHFRSACHFSDSGKALAQLAGEPVQVVRIKLSPGQNIPKLAIREIAIKSAISIDHVQVGPGRGFYDISSAPDVAVWAAKAESQMEAFWPDTAALLYSPNFITPNMVNVVYSTGKDVTPVAATGGGVMTVNADWCRQHPEDTGLTVHETAHVIQSMSNYDPVWLIEGTADYIRWVKFEPEHFQYRIDALKSTYHDSYRTTAAFLGWCELHYDSRLVTKLNEAVRFGRYTSDLFLKLCGKTVDELWTEFVAAYQADPKTVLVPPVPEADQPRSLPLVSPHTTIPQDLLSKFDTVGIYNDGAVFSTDGGVDAGGAAYPASLLGSVQTAGNVSFQIGAAGSSDFMTCRGGEIALSGDKVSSLWLLGTAVNGSQRNQVFEVTYMDGTTQTLAQNFSDWYQPQDFPGEVRAVKLPYRITAAGQKEQHDFYVYAYGFALSGKAIKSLTIPNNEDIKIAAISLAN